MQNWTFDTEPVIRIGRSAENDVVLYSAVVSRRHVEIRRHGTNWEIVSLGANGTYIDGKQVSKTLAVDGMIVRLASSGPKIQINIPPQESPIKRQLAQLQFSPDEPAREENSDSEKETVINH